MKVVLSKIGNPLRRMRRKLRIMAQNGGSSNGIKEKIWKSFLPEEVSPKSAEDIILCTI
jgi:hypothetical protein